MKAVLLLVVLSVVLYAGYAAVRFGGKYQASKKLVREAQGFEREGGAPGPSLLVLGDSTAVGVGAASPKESVAGRLAEALDAGYVENRARSGALVADLASQIEKASRAEYDVVLIQIGGNNIIRFHSPKAQAKLLEDALLKLPPAKRIYLMSAGNVGAATLFPRALRSLYTPLTRSYHRAFGEVAARRRATYVDLYEAPQLDPFIREPGRYLAADGLHPSSEGYGLWFMKLKESGL